MKDENRIVAELYARLWPWLDHSKSFRLMLDDGGQGETRIPTCASPLTPATENCESSLT